MGLNITDARKQIVNYHTKIEKISNDEITNKTVNKYLDFMIDFIEKGGYHSF